MPEPTRNTGLIFNCLKKESWCCAYVGGSLKDWKPASDVNTTCCAINDLTFTAEDPIVYATATVPIKLSIQSTSTEPTSTLFSTISQERTASEITSLPTSDGDASAGDAGQQGTGESGLSTGAKVGLGVGIPVGVLGLAVLGAFFWMRRRKRSSKTKGVAEMYVPNTVDKGSVPPYQETASNHQGAAVYRHEAPSPPVAAELPTPIGPHELPPQTR